MTRDDILFALQHQNTQAFLRVIRAGESSQDDSAYTVMFGGSHFEGFADHPRRKNTVGRLTSTAAGAFQFLSRTWDEMAAKYGLADFSPPNQDIAAVGLIARRGALQLVMEGRIREAIARCAREWASLPGSPYGQPTLTLERALAVYHEHGGALAAPSAAVPVTQEVKPMAAPVLMALLPSLIELIPSIAGLFKGSGSEVAQRNVAAATMVAEAAVKAVGAANAQEAIEKMRDDPEALEAARAAVGVVVSNLMDAGPGVAEARKQMASGDQVPPWKNPAVWVTLVFVPLIYGAAYAVLFVPGFSDEIKVVVITAIFAGLLGSITGFFLGSSLSSRGKDAALAATAQSGRG